MKRCNERILQPYWDVVRTTYLVDGHIALGRDRAPEGRPGQCQLQGSLQRPEDPDVQPCLCRWPWPQVPQRAGASLPDQARECQDLAVQLRDCKCPAHRWLLG